jgi:hypothetical protein
MPTLPPRPGTSLCTLPGIAKLCAGLNTIVGGVPN